VTDPFLPLPDAHALETALAQSARRPIILFKHSPTCGISAQAHADLADWLERDGADVAAYVVHVRANRAVSDEMARRFRIRHESPQVFVVEDGAVRWHGSHWHVNAREVSEAILRGR
jgi:bacillithiol system protein YtxJ